MNLETIWGTAAVVGLVLTTLSGINTSYVIGSDRNPAEDNVSIALAFSGIFLILLPFSVAATLLVGIPYFIGKWRASK